MAERVRYSALFDHTSPGCGPEDGNITIYTGDQVNDDAHDPHDSYCLYAPPVSCYRVCDYTDWDTSLRDLRWTDFAAGWISYDRHDGYDLTWPAHLTSPSAAVPILAAGPGTAYHYDLGYRPNAVRVVHPGNWQTIYGHNSWRIGNGTRVYPGTHIADMGSAHSGPHLHFTLRDRQSRPVDPYNWNGTALWAGGDPLPMGFRDQNGTTHGPFKLDNHTIRTRWLSDAHRLGSPLGNDFRYEFVEDGIRAYCRRQEFERGYVRFCGDSPAEAFYYGRTLLPNIRAGEAGSARNTFISIRNLDTNPADVNITLYTPDGRILDSRTYRELPGGATWRINVRTVLGAFLQHPSYNALFNGSAVVSASQDVAIYARLGRGGKDAGSLGRPAAAAPRQRAEALP
jgi:hypothetical protein